MLTLLRIDFRGLDGPTSTCNDKEGHEGVKWNWDLPIFSQGKWDLVTWDWESQTKKSGNGTRIGAKNRPGNGIWAQFGLGMGLISLPFSGVAPRSHIPPSLGLRFASATIS